VKTLFDYQERALAYAAERSRIALFMEMRLGKTLVTIRWARAQGARRILVLAPVTVLNSWWDELNDEGENKIWWLHGLSRAEKLRTSRFLLGKRTWYLLNYEGLRAAPELIDVPWDVVIADESTAIRNPQAQITKLMLKLRVPCRAILSGLPNPESPLDYFTQMQFVFGNFLGFDNYWVCRQVKFKIGWTGYDWQPKTGTLDEIKAHVHEKAFVLTRKQAGRANEKIYERRMIKPSAEILRLSKHVEKNFEFEDEVTNHAITRVLWQARLAGGFRPDTLEMISGHKMAELLQLVTGELRDQQVVVWFRFNEELKTALTMLRAKGVKVEGIWGKVKARDRGRIVRQFRAGKFRLLCIQGKIGQYSLDLSTASTAIYYSNHYDMEIRGQSEDRIEHPSKKESLLYIDLVSEGLIDEDVVQALKEKKMDSRQMATALLASWGRDFRLSHGLSRVFPGAS